MLNDEFNMKMYSVYNAKKACVIEGSNRTLETKMWRIIFTKGFYRLTDISSNIINEYNLCVEVLMPLQLVLIYKMRKDRQLSS